MASLPVVDLPDPSVLPDSAMLREILATVRRTESSLKEYQDRVIKLETDVDDLNKKVYDLQNLLNLREQQARSKTVRVIGFPFTEEEKSSVDPKFLAKKIHERILTPIYTHAKSTNQIERVPQLATAVETCFRARASTSPTGTARPPPVILKLTTDILKTTLMKNKRLHIPSPSKEEKDLGIERFSIVEDLTPPTFNKMRELQKEESVVKTWTIGGKIFFTVRGDSKIHTVKSVFDPVTTILAKI